MSRQIRYRVTGIVLGGLLLGGPLLINGTASAGQSGADRVSAARPAPSRSGPVGAAGAARAATAVLPAVRHGDGKTKTKTRTASGTPRSAVHVVTSVPAGEKRAVHLGVPRPEVSPPRSDVAAARAPGAEIAAAEPVAMPPSDTRGGGPVGLLALIAAVCVLGVGTAIIRAIVSQRSNQSRMA